MDHEKYKAACNTLQNLVGKNSNIVEICELLDQNHGLQDYLATNMEYTRGISGYPPLNKASFFDCLEVITLLIEKYDLALDARWIVDDIYSMTSLHQAVGNNRPAAVALLLSYGADQTLGGTWQKKPFQNALDLAQQRGHETIVWMLNNTQKGEVMFYSFHYTNFNCN